MAHQVGSDRAWNNLVQAGQGAKSSVKSSPGDGGGHGGEEYDGVGGGAQALLQRLRAKWFVFRGSRVVSIRHDTAVLCPLPPRFQALQTRLSALLEHGDEGAGLVPGWVMAREWRGKGARCNKNVF